jgi:hypothetical protein
MGLPVVGFGRHSLPFLISAFGLLSFLLVMNVFIVY